MTRRGHSGKKNDRGTASFPRRVQPHWWTTCAMLSCLTNAHWRPSRRRHVHSTSRGCCPTWTAECREDRRLGRCRATGPARLRWHRPLDIGHWSPCWSDRWSKQLGESGWHHRLRSEQLSQTRHTSVGVKPPVVGHRGKVDTCQRGCLLGYVSVKACLLDFRLSLPEDGHRDAPRRQECHVPRRCGIQPPRPSVGEGLGRVG